LCAKQICDLSRQDVMTMAHTSPTVKEAATK